MDPLSACLSYQNVVEGLTALGTVGAVVAALALPFWRDRTLRPILSLHHDPVANSVVRPGEAENNRVAVIRITIENAEGKRAAEDVEVVLEEVRVLNHRDRPAVEYLAHRALLVSNSSASRVTISPGGARIFDFVHCFQGDEHMRSAREDVEFDVARDSTDARVNAVGSDIHVRMAVTASNADARRYTTVIHTSVEAWQAGRETQHYGYPEFPQEILSISVPELIP